MTKPIIPIILAGGQGKRLRPLTAPDRPKPFIRFFKGLSLFQLTLQRLSFAENPVVVMHESYAPYAQRQMAEVSVQAQGLTLEPRHRSTTAAIALAAFHLQGRDVLMLVSPSDHAIQSDASFKATVLKAAPHVGDGFVSIGVQPDGPQTRYGYIQYGETETRGVFDIQNFKEKPDKATAQSYLQQGDCAWNTGLFLCTPDAYLNALKIYQPEIFSAIQTAMYEPRSEGTMIHPDAEFYEQCPAEAVDNTIMENLSTAKLCLLNTPWQDLGTLPDMLSYALQSLTRKAA